MREWRRISKYAKMTIDGTLEEVPGILEMESELFLEIVNENSEEKLKLKKKRS